MEYKKLNLTNWKEDYQRRLVTAEEAVQTVKSGDHVFITYARDPFHLISALAARYEELRDVQINMMMAQSDPGWCQPERAASFQVRVGTFAGPIARDWLAENRCDFMPNSFSMRNKVIGRPEESRPLDVLLTVVSPPDKHGYCSFGYGMWTKKQMVQTAKTVIAEVDENVIRTCGDNFVHVSQIDYLVENTQPVMSESDIGSALSQVEDKVRRDKMDNILRSVDPVRRPDFIRLLNLAETEEMERVARRVGAGEPTDEETQLADYVANLVKDGDTVQLGVGRPTANFVAMGVFDNKLDLGVHSEVGVRGLSRLMKAGVVNGKRKTLHPGKAVMTALGGATDDLDFFVDNPALELYDVGYTNDSAVIAANHNMVAINSALSVDLTGQITAETTFGTRIINGPGGQPDFAIGAALSPGGRSITCLQATALDGAVSRIVPVLDEGTAITVSRNYADYVVTEYGIARLMGKTVRERANELIAIAHPDFRAELRKQAQKLFYP